MAYAPSSSKCEDPVPQYRDSIMKILSDSCKVALTNLLQIVNSQMCCGTSNSVDMADGRLHAKRMLLSAVI